MSRVVATTLLVGHSRAYQRTPTRIHTHKGGAAIRRQCGKESDVSFQSRYETVGHVRACPSPRPSPIMTRDRHYTLAARAGGCLWRMGHSTRTI